MKRNCEKTGRSAVGVVKGEMTLEIPLHFAAHAAVYHAVCTFNFPLHSIHRHSTVEQRKYPLTPRKLAQWITVERMEPLESDGEEKSLVTDFFGKFA